MRDVWVIGANDAVQAVCEEGTTEDEARTIARKMQDADEANKDAIMPGHRRVYYHVRLIGIVNKEGKFL